MSTQDAIERAQAWLVEAKREREDHERLNERYPMAALPWIANAALAALGPASVALAVALERFVGPASHHSQCREPESCAICAARDSLAAWTEAVTQPAE